MGCQLEWTHVTLPYSGKRQIRALVLVVVAPGNQIQGDVGVLALQLHHPVFEDSVEVLDLTY